MSLNSRMYRFIGSLRRISLSRSSLGGMDRKQKLLEKIKESEKTKNSNISSQIKKKTNHGEGQDTSRLEIYFLPRAFPHIFGNKIPKKRSETIDMYMHFTPSAIEDPVAARKHAKNEMFNGMERLMIFSRFLRLYLLKPEKAGSSTLNFKKPNKDSIYDNKSATIGLLFVLGMFFHGWILLL